MGYRPIDTLVDPNVKLLPGQEDPLDDPGRYRWLSGKLNYFTVTRPDISFLVSGASRFILLLVIDIVMQFVYILHCIKLATMNKLLKIQMLISQDHLLIGIVHLDIMFKEVIWCHERLRNKV